MKVLCDEFYKYVCALHSYPVRPRRRHTCTPSKHSRIWIKWCQLSSTVWVNCPHFGVLSCPTQILAGPVGLLLADWPLHTPNQVVHGFVHHSWLLLRRSSRLLRSMRTNTQATHFAWQCHWIRVCSCYVINRMLPKQSRQQHCVQYIYIYTHTPISIISMLVFVRIKKHINFHNQYV